MGRWKMVNLRDIVENPQSGEWGNEDKFGTGVPVLRTTNFTDDGIIDYTNVVFREISPKKFEKKALKFGDIIIEKSGGSDTKPVGRVVYYDGVSGQYIYNNFTASIRVNTDAVNTRYLFLLLFCYYKNGITAKYENKTTGIHNLRLNDFLDGIKIPLPPLDEQKRIAKNLDLASEIVKGYKEQLSALDKLVQSVFYEMFGDPVTNEKGWEVTKLSALGELNRGVSKHRPRNAPELLGGNHPLIQTGEVSNSGLYITEYSNTYSDLGLKQSRLWSAGTLCITIAANIAQTAILAFDACFPDSVVGFISGQRTNQIFIHTWFGFFQRILEEQAPQVAQKNINLRILGALDVVVPPLSLQTRFASIVTEIEAHKEQVKQALTEAENLFHSLMQEYFE